MEISGVTRVPGAESSGCQQKVTTVALQPVHLDCAHTCRWYLLSISI